MTSLWLKFQMLSAENMPNNLQNRFSLALTFLHLFAYDVVTNEFLDDGFGSQYQSIISTALYAKLNNKTFVYTPVSKMAHNYINDPDFIAKKEWLMNIVNIFPINNTPDFQTQHKVSNTMSYLDQNIQNPLTSLLLDEFRYYFRLNKDIKKYFNEMYLNIAVHIRRPNPHDNRIAGTDVPDSIFIGVMDSLRGAYSGSLRPLLFHIYSQGDVDHFLQIYNATDVILHINESVEDTFVSMALADILVMSPSSFSYVAGLISNGSVYYFPYWHRPLPNWIKLDMR